VAARMAIMANQRSVAGTAPPCRRWVRARAE
jgi:hypothetical protein